VRAFNTLGWENCADPGFDGVVADLFYAAEDGHAKQADRLIADIGLEPVWLGGVDTFDVVDSLTRLWFLLAFQRKLGRRLAFKMLLGQLIRTHFAGGGPAASLAGFVTAYSESGDCETARAAGLTACAPRTCRSPTSNSPF
jgi:hypothetical protein